jgi:hypothetical protein
MVSKPMFENREVHKTSVNLLFKHLMWLLAQETFIAFYPNVAVLANTSAMVHLILNLPNIHSPQQH